MLKGGFDNVLFFLKKNIKNEIIVFMLNCIVRSKLIENLIKEVFFNFVWVGKVDISLL